MKLSIQEFLLNNQKIDLTNSPAFLAKELSDLYGFQTFHSGEQVEINFLLEKTTLKLEKSYFKGEVKLYVNNEYTFENFFHVISKIIGSKFTQKDLNKYFFDLSISNIKTIEDFKHLLSKHGLINQSEKENWKTKIKEFENLRQIIVNTERKVLTEENEVSRLHDIQTQVEDYLIVEEAIKNDLNYYQNELKSTDVQALKQEKLQSKLPANLSSRVTSFLVKKDEDDFSFRAKGLLGLIALQFLLGVGLYFASFSRGVIILGIFSLVMQIIILIAINLIKSPVDMSTFSNLAMEAPAEKVEVKDSELFLDSAWAGALKSELDKVQKTINRFLNGRTMKDFKTELSEKNRDIAKLNAEIIANALKSMPQKEYSELKDKLRKLEESDNQSTKLDENQLNQYNEVVPIVVGKVDTLPEALANEIKNFLENNFKNQVIYLASPVMQ